MVATYASLGGPASVLYGWLDFCRRYAGKCGGGPLAPLDISLTARAMKEIERVDQWVNAHVKPVSDMEHWFAISSRGGSEKVCRSRLESVSGNYRSEDNCRLRRKPAPLTRRL
jgi:hypothetical protein